MSRRYLEGTMALETTFRTPTGSAVLVDAMAMGRNERGHELGVDSPGIVLRSVSCQCGTVEIELEYAPRFEYGLISPLLRPVQGGIFARGGADILVLSSPIALSIEDSIARARFTLQTGEQASFALQHRASWQETPQVYTQAAITDTCMIPSWMAYLVRPASALRGTLARPGPSQWPCAAGAHVPSHRELSSPRPPPRCQSPLEESATGTIATPGS